MAALAAAVMALAALALQGRAMPVVYQIRHPILIEVAVAEEQGLLAQVASQAAMVALGYLG